MCLIVNTNGTKPTTVHKTEIKYSTDIETTTVNKFKFRDWFLPRGNTEDATTQSSVSLIGDKQTNSSKHSYDKQKVRQYTKDQLCQATDLPNIINDLPRLDRYVQRKQLFDSPTMTTKESSIYISLLPHHNHSINNVESKLDLTSTTK